MTNVGGIWKRDDVAFWKSGGAPPHFYENAGAVSSGDGFANDAATLLYVLEAQKVDALLPPPHLHNVLAGPSAASG